MLPPAHHTPPSRSTPAFASTTQPMWLTPGHCCCAAAPGPPTPRFMTVEVRHYSACHHRFRRLFCSPWAPRALRSGDIDDAAVYPCHGSGVTAWEKSNGKFVFVRLECKRDVAASAVNAPRNDAGERHSTEGGGTELSRARRSLTRHVTATSRMQRR